MFTAVVSPRYYETDAFGQINNTVVTGWFETAREAVFRIFSPEMSGRLNLILARMEIDFRAQIRYGHRVTLRTGIEHVGNASFVVAHEAWQNEQCCARGRAVQVYFNWTRQRSERVPDAYRAQLLQHLLPAAAQDSRLPPNSFAAR